MRFPDRLSLRCAFAGVAWWIAIAAHAEPPTRLVLREAYLDPARHAIPAPDGRSLSVWTASGSAVWDLVGGTPVAGARPGVDPPLAGRAFSPDGRWLAHVEPEGGIGLQDVRTFSARHVLEGHPGGTTALAIDDGDRWLASGGGDGRVRIWNVADGSLVRELGHGARVTGLAFPAGSRYLASASDGGVVRVWDTRRWEIVANLADGGGGVIAMSAGPGGSFVTVSVDGSVGLWGTEPPRRLATLALMKRGDGWLVVTPNGWFDGTPNAIGRLAEWERGEDAARLGWMSESFLRPGLLAEVMAGDVPEPRVPIDRADLRAPRVAFRSVDVEGREGAYRARVRLEVGEAAARDVRLFLDGALVRTWKTPLAGGRQPPAVLEAELPVGDAEVRLSAYAFNLDGVRSEVAVEVLPGDAPGPAASRAHVLTIGINAHQADSLNLLYAAPDAKAFGEGLSEALRGTRRFDEVRLTRLFNREATGTAIVEALERLSKEVTAGDAVFLFFAGNALDDRERFALLPTDVRHEGGRSGVSGDGIDRLFAQGVDSGALTSALQRIGSRWLVLVLDVCNAVSSADGRVRPATLVHSPALARLAQDAGAHVLVRAYDISSEGRSPLVSTGVGRALVDTAADGAPSNGMVELAEWLDWTVAQLSRQVTPAPRLFVPVHPDRSWPLVMARPRASN